MGLRSSVAIYARISQDRDGEGLGVKRQLGDCRADAARRWRAAGAGYTEVRTDAPLPRLVRQIVSGQERVESDRGESHSGESQRANGVP